MSFSNSLKKITSEFTAGLRILKRNIGLKSSCNGAALDRLKSTDVSRLVLPLSATLCEGKTEKFPITLPQADVAIKKNIIEPGKSIKINFDLPIRSSTEIVLDLPFYIQKEIKEPLVGEVISKRATHLVVIRRRKMKKHKYKKFLRKHKIELENKKLKKRAEKEAAFQHSLKNILDEINAYSPENYVNDTLEKVNWKRPLTRVRGYLAPKWVVEEYLEEKKQKEKLNERIQECLK